MSASTRVAVYGLWHLGSVISACLASAGRATVGLDLDADVVANLGRGKPPLFEPGLAERIQAGLASGRLSFTTQPEEALRDAEVLWVAFDTPVDDRDEADVSYVRDRLETVAGRIQPGTLVLVSSQVPVGFTGALERDWKGRGLRFACFAFLIRFLASSNDRRAIARTGRDGGNRLRFSYRCLSRFSLDAHVELR